VTRETRQFLTFIGSQPKGRIGYPMDKWDEAQALAGEALRLGFVKHRPLWPHKNGFQLTDAGKAWIAGEAVYA
jgi:hypothetical protein